MNSWPAHPDDEWIDVTRLGDSAAQSILGASGVERAVARARARYLAGQTTAEEFEETFDRVLASCALSVRP